MTRTPLRTLCSFYLEKQMYQTPLTTETMILRYYWLYQTKPCTALFRENFHVF